MFFYTFGISYRKIIVNLSLFTFILEVFYRIYAMIAVSLAHSMIRILILKTNTGVSNIRETIIYEMIYRINF